MTEPREIMENVIAQLRDLKIDQVPVYLLKTKSAPSDNYEEYFSELNNGRFKPVFVPVLEHQYRDDALRTLRRAAERFAFAGGSEATARQIKTNNPAKRYGGVVFTSQRAVEAFASVVSKLDPSKTTTFFDKDMPMYVVGPATARGVRALGLPCPVVGEDSGNGDALAQFILSHHNSLSREVTHLNGRKLTLLFLVGEQRRDIIPKTLQSDELLASERIPVMEVVVYETGEIATFEEDFTEIIREARTAKAKEQWVVVFSGQGCEAMLSALNWVDEKTGKYSKGRREIMSGPLSTRIATIGPTTRDFLVAELGFEPDVCATKPSPEGVGNAILESTSS